MHVDERTRRLMGEALIRAHGEEAADAIMAHLPPQGYGELATRQDVREAAGALRAEMHEGFARMSERFAGVEERITGVHQEIAGVHKEIAHQVAGVHDRISGVEERITGVHRAIARGTIALLVGLLGSPVVGIVAERLLSP